MKLSEGMWAIVGELYNMQIKHRALTREFEKYLELNNIDVEKIRDNDECLVDICDYGRGMVSKKEFELMLSKYQEKKEDTYKTKKCKCCGNVRKIDKTGLCMQCWLREGDNH